MIHATDSTVSIVNLKPDTEYEVELETLSGKPRLKLKTKNDVFPVGRITVLPEGESDKQITITESGTPGAYHLITVPENSNNTESEKCFRKRDNY